MNKQFLMSNLKFLGVVIAGVSIILVVISISYFQSPETISDELLSTESSPDKVPEITSDNLLFTEPNANRIRDFSGFSPLFRLFIYEDDIGILPNGDTYILEIQAEFKPGLEEIYDEISVLNDKQNTVVIFPIFTSSAYSLYPADISTRDLGFYDYYEGFCDGPITWADDCLTTQIKPDIPKTHNASGMGYKILELLGYDIITDIDVDKNPEILKNYDKVILLHNEYVTKTEFDAITNHPKVLYLYPNALYAEISVDYLENTISLVRGHNYPESEIRNGFGWEFDNTPMEYDELCENWEFYNIDNGMMLNCYPEEIIYKDIKFLKMIKNY